MNKILVFQPLFRSSFFFLKYSQKYYIHRKTELSSIPEARRPISVMHNAYVNEKKLDIESNICQVTHRQLSFRWATAMHPFYRYFTQSVMPCNRENKKTLQQNLNQGYPFPAFAFQIQYLSSISFTFVCKQHCKTLTKIKSDVTNFSQHFRLNFVFCFLLLWFGWLFILNTFPSHFNNHFCHVYLKTVEWSKNKG